MFIVADLRYNINPKNKHHEKEKIYEKKHLL